MKVQTNAASKVTIESLKLGSLCSYQDMYCIRIDVLTSGGIATLLDVADGNEVYADAHGVVTPLHNAVIIIN